MVRFIDGDLFQVRTEFGDELKAAEVRARTANCLQVKPERRNNRWIPCFVVL